MSEAGRASKDTRGALRAATKVAMVPRRSQRHGSQGRKQSGSLVLTAIVVIAALVGMLWAMIALAP